MAVQRQEGAPWKVPTIFSPERKRRKRSSSILRTPPQAAARKVLDASVVRRGDRWWMYLAGQPGGYGATQLFSASLDPGAPLSALGWKLTRNEAGELAPVAGQNLSRPWDGNGGRHCPSYVKGWDPHKREWVERIYYAGAAENLWGPYTIGFLEWNGKAWIDQPDACVRCESRVGTRKRLRTEPHLSRRQMEDVVCGGLEPRKLPRARLR